MNYTMMTDFYEFTMAQTYFDKGEINKKVYFDIFYRKNPFNGGYAISGGLDNIIKFINNFKITDKDIEFLRGTNKFSEEKELLMLQWYQLWNLVQGVLGEKNLQLKHLNMLILGDVLVHLMFMQV